MDIIVSEQNELCMSLKHDTFADLLFTQLIYQLNQISDDDTDYKLCQTHIDSTTELVKYNCCAIVGEKNELICSDYSSVLEGFYTVILIATVYLCVFLFFPLMIDYLKRSMKETTHYTISDSPMSLSSILHMLLVEGHGPAKSFGRKLLIIMCVVVIGLPAKNSNLGIIIELSIWASIFMCLDTYDLFRYVDLTNLSPIEVITSPFNLKLWWRNCEQGMAMFL